MERQQHRRPVDLGRLHQPQHPDAQWFYQFSHIGDVVNYVNTGGPAMKIDDGFGDWNVAWSTWQAGGSVQSSTS